ncbi:MAG TPA: sigma-54-dependent Fis family transcriptional regulator [Bacteroidales bacterium]|jgi:DNA-binding NtrC family response regulator|nr:sigma-54-dependent Fis family transcriptional regulator [Bacteroidales bacterium]
MPQKKGKILIVDDNEELLIAFKFFLSKHFDKISTIKNPNLIPEYLGKESYDIILLDMNFKAGVNTGNEGIFWMKQILEKDPNASVVLITAYGDVELAVNAMKEGAADFIQKSWDEEKILSTILSAYNLRLSKLKIENLEQKQKHLSEKIDSKFSNIIGESAAMKAVFNMIEKVSITDANVLILGENGTGKEVIAREIHRKSKRANEVFVNVDIGALQENLFESELFGHTKGSFTDAKEDRAGRFEIASGGTLFLDEIGNLPLQLQSKLLTAIQNKEICRVGSNKPISVDIRLICATNKNPDEMVEKSTFREDLLYRINTIKINLPPLRERGEDIVLLADFFLVKYTDKYNKPNLKFNLNTISKIKQYSWPGNIRELQHSIEKAVILCDEKIILPGHLWSEGEKQQKNTAPKTFNLDENEKSLIEKAIQKYKGNISSAAKELGINRSTLYKKMEKYGI